MCSKNLRKLVRNDISEGILLGFRKGDKIAVVQLIRNQIEKASIESGIQIIETEMYGTCTYTNQF